jgi:hypothetical protein
VPFYGWSNNQLDVFGWLIGQQDVVCPVEHLHREPFLLRPVFFLVLGGAELAITKLAE